MEYCLKEQDISKLKTEIKALSRQTEENRALAEAVHELAGEIKVINLMIQTSNKNQEQLRRELEKSQAKMEKDLEELKGRPGRRLDNMVSALLGALVTGLAAYIMLQLGLG